jgi:hypothetical protein
MIAIGLGAVVGGWLVWSFGIESYLTKRSALAAEITDKTKDIDRADQLKIQRTERENVLDFLRNGGLDGGLTNSRLGHMIETWANDERRRPQGAVFRITGGSQSNGMASSTSATAKAGFVEIKVQVQATGNQKGLAWVLWNLETAKVPVRVNDISVKPRVEGRDDLTITLNLSTLALAPAAPGSGRTP